MFGDEIIKKSHNRKSESSKRNQKSESGRSQTLENIKRSQKSESGRSQKSESGRSQKSESGRSQTLESGRSQKSESGRSQWKESKAINLIIQQHNSGTTSTDIKLALEKFSTLDSFLVANGCYIKDKTTDHREITHTGMDGRRFHIPMKLYPLVKALLIRDLNRVNPTTYYISEFLTDEFKMFSDFDIESDREIKEKEWEELGFVTQATMKECYQTGTSAAWYMTHPEVKKNSHGETIYKYGLHIVWYGINTNIHLALKVYWALLSEIKGKLPAPEPPSNSWEARLDKEVFGKLGGKKKGNLRLPGNEKMKPCKYCSRARTKMLAEQKTSSRKVKEEKEERDYDKEIEMREKVLGCKHCGGTGKISLGRPYYPHGIFGEDGKIDKVETAKFKNNWDIGLELGTLRLPQGTPLSMIKVLPRNIPEFFDPSKSTDGEKIAPLSKKNKHLEEVLAFTDNRVTWEEKSKEFKIRVDNKNIMTLVQSAIREYNENFSSIDLIDLRTNKRTRPSTWMCTVSGIGSQYCLNKGDCHSGANIYFMITQTGNLYQKCGSRKPIERLHGNVCCKAYSSTHRPLPELVREALVWKKKINGEFKSLDEQLHFKKFESNIKQMRKKFSFFTSNQENLLNGTQDDGKDELFFEKENTIDKFDVESDVERINLVLNKVKRDENGLPKIDKRYEHMLIKLAHTCKNSIGEFDKSEMRICDDDLQNLRLIDIEDVAQKKPREKRTTRKKIT
jgi:hypothetical protein